MTTPSLRELCIRAVWLAVGPEDRAAFERAEEAIRGLPLGMFLDEAQKVRSAPNHAQDGFDPARAGRA